MGLGAALFAAVSVASRTLALVTLAALARLLTPDDFGLVAYAAFATGLLTLMIDRHLEMSMIRLGEIDQRRIDTVFTLRLAFAMILAVALWALAGPISAWLDAPDLAAVLKALTLVAILSGLFNPRFVLFEKDLAFRRVAQVEVATQLASTGIAVLLAILTRSYWSAVVGMIAASATRTGLSWVFAQGRVGMGLTHSGETLRYSVWLMAGALLTFLNGQVNRLFTGAFLGLASLGQFRLGAELAQSVTYFVQRPLLRVAYPGLAEASRRGGDLGRAFLKLQALVTLIMMPMGIGLAITAPYVVRVLAGPGWEEAILVLQVLSALMLLQALMAGTNSLILVDGRTWLTFWRQLAVFAISLPMLWYGGVNHGLQGVLWATAAARFLTTAVTLAIMLRIARISFSELAVALWPGVVATVAMALGLLALQTAIPSHVALGLWEAATLLVLQVALGGAIYGLALLAAWRASGYPDDAVAALVGMARELLGRRAGRKGATR